MDKSHVHFLSRRELRARLCGQMVLASNYQLSWASLSTSLCLSFPTCKMGMIKILSTRGNEGKTLSAVSHGKGSMNCSDLHFHNVKHIKQHLV